MERDKFRRSAISVCLVLASANITWSSAQIRGTVDGPTLTAARCTAPRPARSARKSLSVVLPGGTTLEAVEIPKGSFCMGSTIEEVGLHSNEAPIHLTTIGRSFYLGKYEITEEQWIAVMGKNTGKADQCHRCPVDSVSWIDAKEFIAKLNALKTGYEFRLPSEAEWEYAARAGTKGPYAFGANLLATQANFTGNDSKGNAVKRDNRDLLLPVGTFPANAWGLFDMHGNANEWCEDVYLENYEATPRDGSVNLTGPQANLRVMRGGAAADPVGGLRSAHRSGERSSSHGDAFGYFGLRLVVVKGR